jgi:uncharacterized protein YjbJ (UPF0337 family)
MPQPMANADVIEGKWLQLRGKVKERWAKVTDLDLDRIEGNREQLAGLLQEKYGYAKAKAEQEIDQFLTWAISKY